MTLEGLGRGLISTDSARPPSGLLPAHGLFLPSSGFPHPEVLMVAIPGCQPHRSQASFLENPWAFSLFLSLFKSQSRCCRVRCRPRAYGVPMPTVTSHMGLLLRASTAPRHHRQGNWFSGKEWSGRWPNRCVCANIHLESGCCIISSTCVFPLYQMEPDCLLQITWMRVGNPPSCK